MTNPTGPTVTNDDLVALAAGTDLEGDEVTEVGNLVLEFIAAGNAAMTDLQQQLSNANLVALPPETRDAIKTSFDSAKSKFDTVEDALRAAVAPATPPAQAKARQIRGRRR